MQPRAPISATTLLVALLLFVAGAGLVALLAPVVSAWNTRTLRAERGWAQTPAQTVQTRAAQLERLSQYTWIDRKTGVVAVPIERAMQLYVQESNAESGR